MLISGFIFGAAEEDEDEAESAGSGAFIIFFFEFFWSRTARKLSNVRVYSRPSLWSAVLLCTDDYAEM